MKLKFKKITKTEKVDLYQILENIENDTFEFNDYKYTDKLESAKPIYIDKHCSDFTIYYGAISLKLASESADKEDITNFIKLSKVLEELRITKVVEFEELSIYEVIEDLKQGTYNAENYIDDSIGRYKDLYITYFHDSVYIQDSWLTSGYNRYIDYVIDDDTSEEAANKIIKYAEEQ